MQIYEELVARGLIAQVTNEEEIKKLVNEGKLFSISVLTRPQTAFMSDILWHFA